MAVAPFVLRSGYVELAKIVHSTCGSLTTVFLFTRLWARAQHYHGLWRDDYIREYHYHASASSRWIYSGPWIKQEISLV